MRWFTPQHPRLSDTAARRLGTAGGRPRTAAAGQSCGSAGLALPVWAPLAVSAGTEGLERGRIAARTAPGAGKAVGGAPRFSSPAGRRGEKRGLTRGGKARPLLGPGEPFVPAPCHHPRTPGLPSEAAGQTGGFPRPSRQHSTSDHPKRKTDKLGENPRP